MSSKTFPAAPETRTAPTAGASAAPPHPSGSATDTPERPSLALSGTAIVAGACAAVTSAVVGARLGTAGTIAGAALGSVIGAVATALYTYGLERSHHALRALNPRRGRVVAAVLAAGLAAFGVALLVITGLESTTGTSLAGKPGTTIQQAAAPSTHRGEDGPAGRGEVTGVTPSRADAATDRDTAPRRDPLASRMGAGQDAPAPTTRPTTEPVQPAPAPNSTDATSSASTDTPADASTDTRPGSGPDRSTGGDTAQDTPSASHPSGTGSSDAGGERAERAGSAAPVTAGGPEGPQPGAQPGPAAA